MEEPGEQVAPSRPASRDVLTVHQNSGQPRDILLAERKFGQPQAECMDHKLQEQAPRE